MKFYCGFLLHLVIYIGMFLIDVYRKSEIDPGLSQKDKRENLLPADKAISRSSRPEVFC